MIRMGPAPGFGRAGSAPAGPQARALSIRYRLGSDQCVQELPVAVGFDVEDLVERQCVTGTRLRAAGHASRRDDREGGIGPVEQRQEAEQLEPAAVNLQVVGHHELFEAGLPGAESNQQVTRESNRRVSARHGLLLSAVVKDGVLEFHDVGLVHIRECEIEGVALAVRLLAVEA